MKKTIRLLSAICMLGSSAALAVPSVDSIEIIYFDGIFEHIPGLGGEGIIGWDDPVIDVEGDPFAPRDWIVTGTFDYDYAVFDEAGNIIDDDFGGLSFGPSPLPGVSAIDILAAIVFDGLFATVPLGGDPAAPFGLFSIPLPDVFPVPGGFEQDFDTDGMTTFFGARNPKESILVFFEGDIKVESPRPAKGVPDAGSTATLGLLSISLLVVGRRFTRRAGA